LKKPTRDAGKNLIIQEIHDPGCGFSSSIERSGFSSGYGQEDDFFLIHVLVCTSILCLAKEDPDNNVSACLMTQAAGTGSFV